ncbi:MAG: hypothetical protein Q4E76_03110 [Tissierellia bacterium]|nr:hypothetical protein [Tissierellia bacterium]
MGFLKVEIYIPEEFVIELANDLNERDLLREGNYDYAFTTTQVTSYWRPLEGAKPFDGKVGEVSKAREMKMEFRIEAEDRDEVHRIISRIHPYETPVVNYIALV